MVQQDKWALDRPLYFIAPKEPITIGDSFEGICIYGGPGSGKTTTLGFQLALAMLKANYGVLVLTAKTNEAERWKRLAELAGRSDDLFIFDEAYQQSFNFMRYLGDRQGIDSGLTATLIYIIEELADALDRLSVKQSRGDEQFWSSSRRQLASMAILLCLLTIGHVSIPYILEIIRDAPRNIDESESESWRSKSVTFQLIARAKQQCDARYTTELQEVEAYFMQAWPKLAEKTRSIVEISLFAVLDVFTKGKLHRLFCTDTTVTPDDIVARGKIVVVNLPIKEDFGIGLIGQMIWKICFQQRAEQRGSDEIIPSLCYIDEAQNFLSLRDAAHCATARGSRVCNLWITQNISNVYMALGGGDMAKSASDSLMGLCMTKCFMSNADPVTNEYAQNLIGKRRLRLRSTSISHNPMSQPAPWPFTPPVDISSSSSETFEYILPSHLFTQLEKAGPPHHCGEAVIFQAGRKFRQTGEPYCRVFIPQGF